MKTAKRFGHRYPWVKWFSRSKLTLERGKDFTIMTHGMAQMVRNNASRLKRKVHVTVEQDGKRVKVEVLNPF